MLERDVEAYLVARVETLGGITAKMTVAGRRGWPDRLVTLVGMHLVELKRPKGGKLSAGQVELHRQLGNRGVKVHVLSSREEVDAFIAGLYYDGCRA